MLSSPNKRITPPVCYLGGAFLFSPPCFVCANPRIKCSYCAEAFRFCLFLLALCFFLRVTSFPYAKRFFEIRCRPCALCPEELAHRQRRLQCLAEICALQPQVIFSLFQSEPLCVCIRFRKPNLPVPILLIGHADGQEIWEVALVNLVDSKRRYISTATRGFAAKSSSVWNTLLSSRACIYSSRSLSAIAGVIPPSRS